MASAPMREDPLPPNKSSTFSPGREEYSIARRASSTGFSVRWTMAVGLIFFTYAPSMIGKSIRSGCETVSPVAVTPVTSSA